MNRLSLSERVAIFSVTVRETFAGVIAALISWWLILGADPRQETESRHFYAVVVALVWLVSVGIVLNVTTRYGSRYRWKWVRAGQLGAVVGLIQLGLAQANVAIQFSVTLLGIIAAIACAFSWLRIVTNVKIFNALDAYTTYGVWAAALLISGAFFAQSIQLHVDPEGSSYVARYNVQGWFGLVELQHSELHGVTGCKYAPAIDYGTGCVLIGSDGEELFVRGVLQNWTVAGKAFDTLHESLERGEPFAAQENRLWVFGLYAIGALIVFWIGSSYDPLSHGNTLLQAGDVASDDDDDTSTNSIAEDEQD